MEKSEVSVYTSKVLEKSGSFKTRSSITSTLRPSNAVWHFSVETHDLFFLNNLFRGVSIYELAIVVCMYNEGSQLGHLYGRLPL